MAYYGIITEMELTGSETVTVTYEMRDDATTPNLLVLTERVTFPWILRDGAGDVVTETIGERRSRLQGQFDGEVDALIAELNRAGGQFDTLKSQAIGYRHP